MTSGSNTSHCQRELYIPNHMPSIEEIEQAIRRYETVSRQPQYAASPISRRFRRRSKASGGWANCNKAHSRSCVSQPPPVTN